MSSTRMLPMALSLCLSSPAPLPSPAPCPWSMRAMLHSLYRACAHVCWALGNGKSWFAWLRALLIGAFPPLLWTFSFKQAHHIPLSWRPVIHTWLLPPADDWLMSVGGAAGCTLCLSPIVWYLWHSAHGHPFPRLASAKPSRHPAIAYFKLSPGDVEMNHPLSTPLPPHQHDPDQCPSSSRSSTSTLLDDIFGDEQKEKQAQNRQAHDHGEESTRGWRKVYAITVMTFPLLLYTLHAFAFSSVQDYKDLMAWTTYGALHFASPIVCAWWLWFFAPAGVAKTFGWCLGCQNLAGLATHLFFPNAAPWFYDVYGPSLYPDPPPNYTYPGNSAGLARVDKLLGTRLYSNGFSKSPVVFGAFPSLHAATAVICAYFVSRYSRQKGLVVMMIYTCWMFWSTMYLHHHYAVDLMGGTLYATVSFTIAMTWILPKIEMRHENELRTNGWDRMFLGGGFFQTRLGRRWGSGHWGD